MAKTRMKTAAVLISGLLAPCAASGEVVDWTKTVLYTYDGSGNVTGIGTDQHVYDLVDRLVTSGTNGVRTAFTYDAFGNRQTCQRSGSDCQYGKTIDTTNRISGIDYDAAGNVLAIDGHIFSYDAVNMPTRDVAGTREYVYTAADERIAVYVPDVTSWRWTIRDTSQKVLRELASRDSASGA